MSVQCSGNSVQYSVISVQLLLVLRSKFFKGVFFFCLDAKETKDQA